MSANMSPFMVVYGRPPPSLHRMGNNLTPVDSLGSWLKERDAILDDLRFHFLRTQHRMKQWADLKRKPESFELGDLVFLKLQP